ncbi:aldo/keto reductase [Streptococcus hyointestinalis]|uniref:2,5-diketo-D-gluconic acid reductase n=1 Tax=Streptococcus hyointestinalis TaxID=1337 RepID=A0A380K8T1_9STRE|nr:aldo/keto reductase [Streptococcus hyointestinalis]SUN60690.1 2,5-diketo-D-gluconic acid reductase [Streptococcus hyointestinalis]
MSIFTETYTLNNGIAIPKIGLGTWEIENDKAAQAVRDAIAIGYRHIDTAEGYNNEAGVGEGIRTSGISRKELFVTTKLQAAYKTYDEAKAGIEQSLADHDIDYIDLMIIHAPQPWESFREGEHFFEGNLEAWKALEEHYQLGKIKAIGVSNFDEIDLQNILDNGSVKPAVNQILCHVGNTPFKLIDFCQKNDILVEAYSPIAHGAILGNTQIQAIADKYDVSLPQLCIKYDLQLNTVVIPKTANPAHMLSNAELDFIISENDMETLKTIGSIDYGEASVFPVYGGKISADGSPRD